MINEDNAHAKSTIPTRRKFLSGAGAVGSAAILAASNTKKAKSTESPAIIKPASAADRLRNLIAAPESISAPVVYDLMSAKLAQYLGFPLITVGGSTVSSGMYGMGDYGMATITELIEVAARMAAGVDIPVIADADDCGGNPLNVYRALRRYAQADVACVLIEDMSGAKHVPGRPEGRLISAAEMVDKIKAAVDAAGIGGPAILARCDGLSKDLSFEESLERIVMYSEAGAELVFMSGAQPAQHRVVAETTGKAVFSTGGGKNTADILAAHKVKVAVFAIESFALNAAHQAMRDLKQHGDPSRTLLGLPREVSSELYDSKHWAEISRRFNAQSY